MFGAYTEFAFEILDSCINCIGGVPIIKGKNHNYYVECDLCMNKCKPQESKGEAMAEWNKQQRGYNKKIERKVETCTINKATL